MYNCLKAEIKFKKFVFKLFYYNLDKFLLTNTSIKLHIQILFTLASPGPALAPSHG